MAAESPILCQWDGEVFRPVPTMQQECDRRFVVGGHYRMVDWEDRSEISHKHEFAWLREAWMQLPERLVHLYPSPEHLRKRALIQGGFFDQEAIDAGDEDGALRIAAWIRAKDDFAHVVVVGSIVLVRTAKSQSHRAMGKDAFQRSKDAVLEIVSDLLGITPEQLRRHTGRAA